jgi:hypothetical protein
MSGLNLCINTSVSALDSTEVRERSLTQYERIKPYVKSVLRIVSCDFNTDNTSGHALAKMQTALFRNEATIDTVFRPNKNNPLVLCGVINVANVSFMGKKTLASKFNKKTFTGKCANCAEQCGVGISVRTAHLNRPGIKTQLDFLKAVKNKSARNLADAESHMEQELIPVE